VPPVPGRDVDVSTEGRSDRVAAAGVPEPVGQLPEPVSGALVAARAVVRGQAEHGRRGGVGVHDEPLRALCSPGARVLSVPGETLLVDDVQKGVDGVGQVVGDPGVGVGERPVAPPERPARAGGPPPVPRLARRGPVDPDPVDDVGVRVPEDGLVQLRIGHEVEKAAVVELHVPDERQGLPGPFEAVVVAVDPVVVQIDHCGPRDVIYARDALAARVEPLVVGPGRRAPPELRRRLRVDPPHVQRRPVGRLERVVEMLQVSEYHPRK
jgi:hypothetical protein